MSEKTAEAWGIVHQARFTWLGENPPSPETTEALIEALTQPTNQGELMTAIPTRRRLTVLARLYLGCLALYVFVAVVAAFETVVQLNHHHYGNAAVILLFLAATAIRCWIDLYRFLVLRKENR